MSFEVNDGREESEESICLYFRFIFPCEDENRSQLIIDDHQIDQSSCIRTPSLFDFTLHIQLTLVLCYIIIIIRRTLRFSLYLSSGIYKTSSTVLLVDRTRSLI